MIASIRHHIKAHGLVAGFVEWWRYAAPWNWEEVPTPVDVKPRRLDHVFSIRLNSEELRHLSEAATLRGLTLGQYIKRASIQQATDDTQVGSGLTATIGYGHVVVKRIS